MPSPNITETLSLSHAIVATAPASGTSPKTIAITGNSKTNQTGSRVVVGIQQATTTPAAVDISVLSGGTLGRYAFKNLDGVNNLNVLSAATTGVCFLTLLPGEMAQGRFGTDVTAPAVAAATGTILAEYMICEA